LVMLVVGGDGEWAAVVMVVVGGNDEWVKVVVVVVMVGDAPNCLPSRINPISPHGMSSQMYRVYSLGGDLSVSYTGHELKIS
jgi:hypothetical protein